MKQWEKLFQADIVRNGGDDWGGQFIIFRRH